MINTNNNTKGIPVIGAIVFWSLKDVAISRAELANLFASHGLNKDYLPPVISGRKAFSRALKDFEKKAQQKLVRKIVEDEDIIAFGIVAENPDEVSMNLDYETEDVVIFDKKNEVVRLKLNKFSQRFIDNEFSYFKSTYTADDIRKMITDILKDHLNAFLIRKTGGVYFVPADRVDELRTLQKVIEEIGNSELYILDIPDIERTKKTAIKLFKEEIEEELKESAERVKEVVQKDKVRDKTIKNAFESFNKAKEKLQMFKQLLSFTAEEIEEKIKSYEDEIKKIVIGNLNV